jgi:hypothetical protein
MKILRDWEISLTVDQVLLGQGADPQVIRKRRPALIQIAEWALSEGTQLIEPAVLVEEFEVLGVRHERLLLSGGAALAGSLIVQHLAGASQVILMVCTIGGQLESVSQELMKTDPLLALGLEGVGTAAVEALGTMACSRFETRAREAGLQPSIPLSPGMVGWPVDPGQKQVFSLVDAAQIGVSLTSSLMMKPRMSLTQALGFGAEMAFQGRTCDYCSLNETCRYQDHYAQAHEKSPPG